MKRVLFKFVFIMLVHSLCELSEHIEPEFKNLMYLSYNKKEK